jgi:hypothetical protein
MFVLQSPHHTPHTSPSPWFLLVICFGDSPISSTVLQNLTLCSPKEFRRRFGGVSRHCRSMSQGSKSTSSSLSLLPTSCFCAASLDTGLTVATRSCFGTCQLFQNILYNVGVTRSLLNPSCTRNSLKTPFGLVIPFITILARNHNYSQLFITLCYLYTTYKHLYVRN